MFEWPYKINAKHYKLHLAYDSTQQKNDFTSFLVTVQLDKTPATRIDKLPLGKKYKWYVETILKTGQIIKSDIHYFSILSTIYSDTSSYKRKINYPSKNKQGVIWCDFSHCAFDRDGNIVWFMPTENNEYKETSRVRDLRFLNDGTITFIKNPGAFHTNLNIETIWKAPLTGENDDKYKTGYHHSLQKLANGNYMVLAYDFVELEKTAKNDTVTNRVELVNVIEFTKTGHIEWIWEMREHFPLDILATPTEFNRGIINAHCNAFSIDKNNEFIYLGFRDISRIIKINKTTKQIISSYGKKLNNADSLVNETNLFSYPHDAKVLQNNHIMVLNNNDFVNNKISTLEIFEQPKNNKQTIKPNWSFSFKFDSLNNGKSMKLGNVKLMNNGNYLINQGSNNRIVEITKNKKVLWDMMLYRFDSEKNKWTNAGPYRIDYSSSLYPYYFSVNYNQSYSVVTIFNEGDFKDAYCVEIVDGNNQVLQTIETTKLVVVQKSKCIKLAGNLANAKLIRVTSIASKKQKQITIN